MSWMEETALTAVIALSPILLALLVGAIGWAARRFGEPTERRTHETRRV